MSMTTKKRVLEGIKVTDDLFTLWKECYDRPATSSISNDENETASYTIIHESSINNDDGDEPKKRPDYMPLDVLLAIQTILNDDPRLEKILEQTKPSLVFTPKDDTTSSGKSTEGQRKFQERLKRLRLQQEETKYSKLTNNLGKPQDDEITAKSMTYAASVGLNMIVAPISFGVFMYFFAGGIFDYWVSSVIDDDDNESTKSHRGSTVDIKRVIVGVISGVMMLFIEMILFVIRTHEFEEANRKKSKRKKKNQPFGVYAKDHQSGMTFPAQPTSKQQSKTTTTTTTKAIGPSPKKKNPILKKQD